MDYDRRANNPPHLRDDQLARAGELFSYGSDTADIAYILNVPEATVYNSLQRARDRIRLERHRQTIARTDIRFGLWHTPVIGK